VAVASNSSQIDSIDGRPEVQQSKSKPADTGSEIETKFNRTDDDDDEEEGDDDEDEEDEKMEPTVGDNRLPPYPLLFYFTVSTGVKYCDEHVCMSVSLLAYLIIDTSKFRKIFSLHATCGDGSVLV